MVCYDQIATHRWMIRDSARTSAFREALMKTVAPGSAVLDVGAGTGILSLFAAQAGARVVYAVERAPIAALAAKLVESNGLSHTVRVVRTNIEGAELPGVRTLRDSHDRRIRRRESSHANGYRGRRARGE